MRAWDELEAAERRAREQRIAEHEATLDQLAAEGIDLDPEASAQRLAEPARTPDGEPEPASDAEPEHAHAHPHPHAHAGAGDRPSTGIIGAGSVGLALGVALSRAGWPVGAVASRDAGRRARFKERVPNVRAFAEAAALVDDVELIIVAVPDDAIVSMAGSLRLYAGQAIVHTSGLLGAEALAPALSAGTQAGAFHPLVAFADLDRALASLHGATVAIEGDDDLVAHLADMAEAIGAAPVRLPPGSKAAYHAAAVLAAGGVVALLDTIREVAGSFGLEEAGALQIYLPLVEQTVANARALGIETALTGPATRGDAGTVAAHLAALAAAAPAALPAYRALLARDVDIATRRGALSPEATEHLRTALAGDS
jgi:predicted short-subunit dehydrogenase-like oxidoreductase (DUF2520 family)